jgi:hypothetical protein
MSWLTLLIVLKEESKQSPRKEVLGNISTKLLNNDELPSGWTGLATTAFISIVTGIGLKLSTTTNPPTKIYVKCTKQLDIL